MHKGSPFEESERTRLASHLYYLQSQDKVCVYEWVQKFPGMSHFCFLFYVTNSNYDTKLFQPNMTLKEKRKDLGLEPK